MLIIKPKVIGKRKKTGGFIFPRTLQPYGLKSINPLGYGNGLFDIAKKLVKKSGFTIMFL